MKEQPTIVQPHANSTNTIDAIRGNIAHSFIIPARISLKENARIMTIANIDIHNLNQPKLKTQEDKETNSD